MVTFLISTTFVKINITWDAIDELVLGVKAQKQEFRIVENTTSILKLMKIVMPKNESKYAKILASLKEKKSDFKWYS